MIAILTLYLLESVKRSGRAFVMLSVIFFGIRILSPNLSQFHLVGISVLLWGGFCIRQWVTLLPKNWDWMVLLPFHRLQLVSVVLLINSLIFIFSLLGCMLMIGANDLLSRSLQGPGLNGLLVFFSLSKNGLRQLYRIVLVDKSAPAFSLLILIFTITVSILTAPRWHFASFVKSIANWSSKTTHRTLIAILIPMAFISLYRYWGHSPFFLFSALLLIIWQYLPYEWRQNYRFTRTQAQRIPIVALLWWIGVVSFTGVWAGRCLNSGSIARQVSALHFLGPIRMGNYQEKIENLIKADLEEPLLRSLLHDYHKFLAENPRHRRLSFKQMIENKSNLESVHRILSSFDITHFTREDIEPILERFKSNELDSKLQRILLTLTPLPLLESELTDFLSSNSRLKTHFALLKLRYDPNPRLISSLRRQIDHLDESQISDGLLTLSLLEKRKIGFQEWFTSSKKNRALASSIEVEIDCDKQIPRSRAELDTVPELVLNQCLRSWADRSDPFLMLDIEEIGWFQQPLTPYRATIVNEVLSRRGIE